MKLKKKFNSISFLLIIVSFATFLQKPAAAQESGEYFKSGRLYYINRDIAKAKNCFETALKLNPEYAEAWRELGVCYMEEGDFEKAINLLSQSLELNPDSPKSNYAIAVAYLKKEEPDVELAKKCYNKAVKLGYSIPEWFLSFLQRCEEGVKVYE
ncbi:MAG: tetratricopeptide repeat protein [Candidatus Kaelpia aquatica]|nr:tetratricopeptide repeat protein [Candidatus Kaelpia aquatica]